MREGFSAPRSPLYTSVLNMGRRGGGVLIMLKGFYIIIVIFRRLDDIDTVDKYRLEHGVDLHSVLLTSHSGGDRRTRRLQSKCPNRRNVAHSMSVP